MLTATSVKNIKRRFRHIVLLSTVAAVCACSKAPAPRSDSNITEADTTAPSHFDNPIIKYDTQDPTNEVGEFIYTADPAVMVTDDTVYLYSTHDEQHAEGKDYRMYDYRLWTSKDMINWQNKGAVFRAADFSWARTDEKTLDEELFDLSR